MNRRSFLKLCGLAAGGLSLGFSTTACSRYQKNVKWDEVPDSEFSIKKFDYWFEAYKLNHDINPNLNFSQQGFYPSFNRSIRMMVSPGIDYNSGKMYAVADGKVSYIGKISPSPDRLGGDVLHVSHPDDSTGRPIFLSDYAHLATIHVKYGEYVKRGQLLADVMWNDHAKLMFKHGVNWVTPDNYGINHGYMDYWDERTDLDIFDTATMDAKQRALIERLCGYALQINLKALRMKQHRQFHEKFCLYDDVEIFRYLSELYEARPRLFPNLPKDNFNEIKNEFYANQPIILTLPLKA